MRKDQNLPQQRMIGRPFCEFCKAQLWLACIEPDKPGYDKRTFECPVCPTQATLRLAAAAVKKARLAGSRAKSYGRNVTIEHLSRLSRKNLSCVFHGGCQRLWDLMRAASPTIAAANRADSMVSESSAAQESKTRSRSRYQ